MSAYVLKIKKGGFNMEFYEEWVNNVAESMCGWSHKKDLSDFENEISKEQRKIVADRLRNDKEVEELFKRVDTICANYIAEELNLI